MGLSYTQTESQHNAPSNPVCWTENGAFAFFIH